VLASLRASISEAKLSLAPQGAYFGEMGGSGKMEHAETHGSAFLTCRKS